MGISFKALTLLPAFLLVACGSGSSNTGSGPICHDPQAPVDYAVSGFTVTENMQRTYAYYVLAGMQPGAANSAAIQSAIDNMEIFIRQYIQYTGPESNITSTTNELDLLESIIASDAVDNFRRAKSTMVDSIRQDLACGYNNANIRVTTQVDGEEKEKLYTLSYNFAPDADSNPDTVTPILTKTLVHKTPSSTGKTNFSPVAVLKLNHTTYQSAGFNAPLFVQANYGGSDAALALTLDGQNRKDTVGYTASTAFELNADYPAAKRLRFQQTYDSNEVKIFVSNFISAYSVPDGSRLEDPSSATLAAVYKTYGQPAADATYDSASNSYAYPAKEGETERRLYQPTEEELEALYQRWGAVKVPRYYDPNYDTTTEQTASPVYIYQGTLINRVNQ
ncbi:MAG: hypothetical protein H6999_07130 [Hahellaceae bacterium]|nr:hypothetical protein [Hahellaceae bacterium]